MSKLTDHVVFNDSKLARRYESGRIPIDTLFEAYFDGALDIPGDIFALLEDRHVIVKHAFTPAHVKYFLTKFVPESVIHTKKLDTELVRWHYDRGNDFFAAFLGDRMVYTSAFFTNPAQTLEEGQDQKLDMVCQKLQLKPGDRLLDIGCGWGTLALHAAKYYGVDATGVTLSKNQTQFGNDRIAKAGLSAKARIECMDYRDIPRGKFNKISNLEMVEHVGVKNLKPFYEQVYELLEDQGLFLMQWTGLRRGSNTEDLIWGLFMAKYIFAGADASLPLAPMMNAMEKANWEIHSIENVSTHYRHTIKKWHDNWLSNADTIKATYGERWFRIWHVFLAWAVVAAGQGTAACFQVLSNKNLNDFNRDIWVGKQASMGERMKLPQRGALVADAELAERGSSPRRRRSRVIPGSQRRGGCRESRSAAQRRRAHSHLQLPFLHLSISPGGHGLEPPIPCPPCISPLPPAPGPGPPPPIAPWPPLPGLPLLPPTPALGLPPTPALGLPPAGSPPTPLAPPDPAIGGSPPAPVAGSPLAPVAGSPPAPTEGSPPAPAAGAPPVPVAGAPPAPAARAPPTPAALPAPGNPAVDAPPLWAPPFPPFPVVPALPAAPPPPTWASAPPAEDASGASGTTS